MNKYTTVLVRPFRADDRPEVLALNAELQEFERALRPSRSAGAAMTAEYVTMLESRLDDEEEDGALYVATYDGHVLGFISCFVSEDTLESTPEEVMINDFVVAAAARRQGVGRALFEAVRTFAHTRGISRLIVSVLENSADARAAYVALGFRPATTTFEAVVE